MVGQILPDLVRHSVNNGNFKKNDNFFARCYIIQHLILLKHSTTFTSFILDYCNSYYNL